MARGWRPGGRAAGGVPGGAGSAAGGSREFATGWARSGPARVTRAAFLGGAMGPLLRSTLTVRAWGAEVFDEVRDTPVIIVSNHSSHLDAPLLLCVLPRQVRARTAVTAAADYFFGSVWRGASSALAFATVPVDRGGGAPSATPMNLLRDGWNLVIFPEGTRSRDGARGRFRLGAAYLSINAGVPVVPVGVRGAFAAMPRGRSWPVPGRAPVTVRFGRPLRPAAGEDVRTFSARLAAEVDRLCAEDASSWWDSPRAAQTPVDSPPVDSPAVAGVAGPAGASAAGDGPAAAGSGGAGQGGEVGVTGAAGVAPAGAVARRGGPAGVVGRGVGRARMRAAGGAGSPAVSARLRGAPGTPAARWRRIWAATEPAPRATSRSPWRR
ncbi:1-acyl-sn-glycerol-3-phosphate acyltransferase [Frankia sp. AgB32]|nr:1-acyl-sn-glycerol-3-phosphate acyltransferase [Frankia sp. AgB32]